MNTPTATPVDRALRGPRLAFSLNGPRRVLRHEINAQADMVRLMFKLYREEQDSADPSYWVLKATRDRIRLAAATRREHLQALRILEAAQ